jgi:hypothetical protein
MVGSFYFLGMKSDWDYNSGYKALQDRYLNKFATKQGVDLKKAETLRVYLEQLEEKIHMVSPSIHDELTQDEK